MQWEKKKEYAIKFFQRWGQRFRVRISRTDRIAVTILLSDCTGSKGAEELREVDKVCLGSYTSPIGHMPDEVFSRIQKVRFALTNWKHSRLRRQTHLAFKGHINTAAIRTVLIINMSSDDRCTEIARVRCDNCSESLSYFLRYCGWHLEEDIPALRMSGHSCLCKFSIDTDPVQFLLPSTVYHAKAKLICHQKRHPPRFLCPPNWWRQPAHLYGPGKILVSARPGLRTMCLNQGSRRNCTHTGRRATWHRFLVVSLKILSRQLTSKNFQWFDVFGS